MTADEAGRWARAEARPVFAEARVAVCPDQSGGGPPHSTTLARGVIYPAQEERLAARRRMEE